MSEENKVAAEVAESEFNRWATAMDLARKFDTDVMNAEDKEAFQAEKRILLAALQKSSLVVDGEGQFVFTLQGGDKTTITFFEPDGASLMAIDKVAKSGHADVAKSYAILAAITKQSVPFFAKMKNRDLSVCQAILKFFLAR